MFPQRVTSTSALWDNEIDLVGSEGLEGMKVGVRSPRSGNFLFKHEFYEHEFTSACTRDGYFFSIGVCPRVIFGGTRPGIANKCLMGVIIRVW